MLKKMIWACINKCSRAILSPRMIMGYKCKGNGKYLSNTRISNTALIGNPESFYVEDNVFIGHYNLLDASNKLSIGEGCQISNYALILTHSSHIAVRLYGRQYIAHNGNHVGYYKGSVSIGAYTFLGPHSVIMPGTKLGKGSLISAYSYVKSGEYPDFAILGGNPAVVIGDTREIDQKYLEQHPELLNFYHEWAHDAK